MTFTIAEIAREIGASAVGDLTLEVSSIAEPATARDDQLAIATTVKFVEQIAVGDAQAALLDSKTDWKSLGLKAAILLQRPRYALAGITKHFDRGQKLKEGIHQTALIDPTAKVDPSVSIGAYSVIGSAATVGRDSVIGPFCMIGAEATIGPECYLRDHVSIGARVTIGARFIGQPGVRVGGDGFSYVTPSISGVENVRKTLGHRCDAVAQEYVRIHSLGAVWIGDDVEMGANSTVDNGTIRDTQIGNGCKFDNLTHVGHNVVMGQNCLVSGQSGIAGSAVIGKNVVLGGQTGVSDNIFVGDNVVVGGGSKILSNVPAGKVVLGYPAIKMDQQIECYKAVRRLPRFMREIEMFRKNLLGGKT
ncbi:MAG: UDP-3-O-(3-hydroxymyristoyl)glucosamine N-acyltransferase [Aestuariivita sp.]|nr:UDP-3-O-(3-hydroxymyristoyl)glucosamine N-acyltransferase [Aestuariivita sp.]MCY4202650.1 UDP-3-O-(3-hydroxymyristoyl)glucosamine N-acyltransferase [Aestuariivita sp.]MCY4288489.1 UDP-3-O-(3-hydroxymyristoyl)glucosamine N-acyltransferase [Aestuariivita sp.]MCY4347073.1 UDP-3-O-(3-hydroxymyristoyl)glucosamine N-acyltransferase [Aestuariivita sp.]